MTVKEMIEELKELNPNMDIVYRNEGIWCDCIYPRVEKIEDKEVVVVGR